MYDDMGNPVVTIQIQGCTFPNTLVDLGATINILTRETCSILGIPTLKPTSNLIELYDRSVFRIEGTLKEIIVFVDSWEYPVDVLVINLTNRLDKHALILGSPWLATIDSYIGCRIGNMIIAKGNTRRNLVLYPPT